MPSTKVDKLMHNVYTAVADALDAAGTGTTQWSERQRSLLLACETGVASAAQRRWARRMLAEDPVCRAQLRALRNTVRDVAAALPVPAACEQDRAVGVLDTVVDWVRSVVGTSRRTAHQVAEGVAPSGAAEPIAAGAAGIGTGVAVKAAAACLAAGGTLAVCLSVPLAREDPTPAEGMADPRPPIVEPARTDVIVVRSKPPPSPPPAPKAKKRKRQAPATTTASNPPVSSPNYQTPASPAPAGSEEFGPGNLGSSDAPAQPAPAPTDGGGEFTP